MRLPQAGEVGGRAQPPQARPLALGDEPVPAEGSARPRRPATASAPAGRRPSAGAARPRTPVRRSAPPAPAPRRALPGPCPRHPPACARRPGGRCTGATRIARRWPGRPRAPPAAAPRPPGYPRVGGQPAVPDLGALRVVRERVLASRALRTRPPTLGARPAPEEEGRHRRPVQGRRPACNGCASPPRQLDRLRAPRPCAVGVAEQQHVREQEGQERGIGLDGEARRRLLRGGEAGQPLSKCLSAGTRRPSCWKAPPIRR